MTTPPRAVEALLSALGAENRFRDALLGDMAEELNTRAERDGVVAARWWYYGEALRSAPHLLGNWARRAKWSDVSHIANTIVITYTAMLAIGIVVAGCVWAVGGKPPSMKLAIAHADPGLLALLTLLGLTSTSVGGFIAASVDDRTPLLSAIALGATWSAIDAIGYALAAQRPLWFAIVPFIPIVGATLGGVIRVSRRAPA